MSNKLRDDDLVSRLPRALSSLHHRGPDGHGTAIVDHAIFGHARLAIIDLTAAANQPMTVGDRMTIVFNGEIYNYRELYSQFLTDDPNVNPRSDTSVLLGMFRKFRHDMLPYLNGMFAVAIYDATLKQLFLARDRFGEKPLFYFVDNNSFCFGSETRAIRELAGRSKFSTDPMAVALYLHLGSIPSPHTIFEQIKCVPPAHYAYIGVGESSPPVFHRYWRLGQTAEGFKVSDFDGSIQERTHELMAEALRSRLVSDVPVGLFLSGGLDSGALASLASETTSTRLSAVVVDFAEKTYSEGEMARQTAEAFGIPVTRREIGAQQFMGYLNDFFKAADQPTADGFNTYIVSKAAHELGGKVWLSGVGGDELFGGYPSFSRIGPLRRFATAMKVVPGHTLMRGLADRLALPMRLQRALTLAAPGPEYVREYQVLRAPLPFNQVRRLAPRMTQGMDGQFADPLISRAVQGDDAFQVASSLETQLYMGNQLLRDIDNFSMANSIELRAPFLDHRLFDFVYRLPEKIKLRGSTKKPLMVESLKQALPLSVANAPKRGFTFPLQIWIRDEFSATFMELTTDSRLRNLLEPREVSRIWQMYNQGRAHWSVVWNIYALARWVLEHEHY